jgi:hypothetical protein
MRLMLLKVNIYINLLRRLINMPNDNEADILFILILMIGVILSLAFLGSNKNERKLKAKECLCKKQ